MTNHYMNVSALKKQLRRVMRERKAAMTEEQKQLEAVAVFSAIEHTTAFADARSVLLYYSLPDELPTHQAVQRWATMKDLYLPRVSGDDLELVRYNGILDDNNPFHIAEPVGPPCRISPDLVIVPGVAFDSRCNRMGRGRGFYDRMLNNAHSYTIGVALSCQMVERVPCEPHDRPLDAVVTATQTFFRETEP